MQSFFTLNIQEYRHLLSCVPICCCFLFKHRSVPQSGNSLTLFHIFNYFGDLQEQSTLSPNFHFAFKSSVGVFPFLRKLKTVVALSVRVTRQQHRLHSSVALKVFRAVFPACFSRFTSFMLRQDRIRCVCVALRFFLSFRHHYMDTKTSVDFLACTYFSFGMLKCSCMLHPRLFLGGNMGKLLRSYFTKSLIQHRKGYLRTYF